MVQCRPPLLLEEIPKEDEERLEKLFAKLDTDGNGKIDIHDLSAALKELAPHINRSYAEVRISTFLINFAVTVSPFHGMFVYLWTRSRRVVLKFAICSML